MGALGMIVGGIIPAYLLSLLAGVPLKRLEPENRALLASAIGLILCWLLAGWGMADGNSFAWTAGFFYVPGALVAFFFLLKRYSNQVHETDAGIADVFE